MPSRPINGGFRLFTLFGITVYLHFTWFLVAAWEIQSRKGVYSSIAWNIAEVLALFAIILTHEFGHALACRSVGGKADTIMLWPLGGVAFVSPPQRPGAVLWCIAAGPLVNVLLVPVTFHFLSLPPDTDLHRLLYTIAVINLGLLIFNMLPVYPLDGGQILRALLWFVIGQGRSLMAAAVIGLFGAAAFAAWAFHVGDPLLGAIAIFAGYQAWRGFQSARNIRRSETLPRRAGLACPKCGTPPPVGRFWNCSNCRRPFDTFEQSCVCPNCGTAHRVAFCPSCRTGAPLAAWMGLPATMPAPPSITMPPLPPLPTMPQHPPMQPAPRPPPPPL